MKRSYWLGFLPLLLLLAAAPGRTAHGAEYRQVVLADGTTYSGVVTGSDGEHLVLETPSGDLALPMMDIVQIQSISRETFLHATDAYVLCVPFKGEGVPLDAVARVEETLCRDLSREMVEPVLSNDLSPEIQTRIQACADVSCLREVAETLDAGRILTGAIRTTATGLALLASLHPVGPGEVTQASAAFSSLEEESESLERCARLLLGESVGEEAGPEAVPAWPDADAPTQSNLEPAEEPDGGGTEAGPSGERQEPAGDHSLWATLKVDLIPVPGIWSTVTYDRPWGTVAAGTAVAATTGLTVYFAGDLRKLGLDHGLPVPWTYEERGARDAAFLTGIGAASYLVSTWVANVIVRKVNERRARTH